jgi:RNA polymerase sigma-70 factor, ECF subfamily
MIVIVLPDIATEDRLLAAARRNDQDAMMHIYDTYFPPIYSFIRLRVADTDTAEDLASDVFVRLVSAMRSHKAPHHSLRGWLFRVARNLINDHYGRNRKFTEEVLEEWVPSPNDPDPEVQFFRALDIERVRRALRMLADDQQEVLLLRFSQMLSLQEAADIMGRNVGAIKSLQFRAVNTLRQILGEYRMEGERG